MAVAPKPNDWGGPALPSENTEQSSNQPNNSWIFHPNLIRKKLVVTAHGGGYLNKKLVVHPIQQEDGRTEIVWDHYNKQHIISPQWVYPRHPNHARDNGLLVVIAGEHTGKYVRRFNHAVSGSLFVEVVDHSEGKMDQLTGEELCVTAQEVCIAFESSGDRELNRNVMKQKRDRYYKTHRR
ncbi:hypothetical protein K435DRAFT_777453 [Dendrothele bispora CBS 962.96]|uniref:KOW domain-containing protein n=1 Tax=Dendrothele bispora (strain CBS 962.96) TaxID=1314807 RepID=A0A4S8M7Z9_DENBC|nr:hypothetical protein K435DRAFT_777453 [Dendrothele bispora CBS 962.96]